MNVKITKQLGRWVVEFDDQTNIFDDHDEAVEFAYNQGAVKFQIIYKPLLQRTLDRSGVEVLILNK